MQEIKYDFLGFIVPYITHCLCEAIRFQSGNFLLLELLGSAKLVHGMRNRGLWNPEVNSRNPESS